ncbi:pectinesterase 3-like [Apium graveolens]|uniref:pectinesterase 3-like n=1 Tax=Apium graveolens TaxID=4045 RepID=UPI003D78FA9B
MSSIDLFKRELEEHAFRKKARKRLIIIAVSIVLLVIIIIAATVGGLKRNDNSNKSPPSTSTEDSIRAVCEVTLYPDSCSSSISSLKSSTNSTSNNPEDFFVLSLQAAINALEKFSSFTHMLVDSNSNYDSLSKSALRNCESIIWDSIGYINMSVVRFEETENKLSPSTSTINDIRTWLSAAMTYQETCIDGLQEFSRGNLELTEEVKTAMRNSTEFTSNSLAIVTKILSKLRFPMNRKLLYSEADGTPSWQLHDHWRSSEKHS